MLFPSSILTLPLSLHRALLLCGAFFLYGASAWAFPVSVELIRVVQQGESPKLVLHVLETAQNAAIQLKREDGKSFRFGLGNLVADQEKEIVLDGRLGRHTYEGEMTAEVEGEKLSSPLQFETVVAAPMTLDVDREQLDLERRRLVLRASAKLAQAELSIFGPDGEQIYSQKFDLSGSAPQKPITLRWTGTNAQDIVRLELRVTDEDGFFKAIALTPWSVHIPHEEVLFANNSAEISSAEEDKLSASLDELKKILERFRQVRGVQLFIAGHTDTVGKPAHNAHLSRLRAQAIGRWFTSHEVPIPVYFEGFGESSLKVKTADEVAEPRNRRVDYILSVEPPTLKSSAHGWKRLK